MTSLEPIRLAVPPALLLLFALGGCSDSSAEGSTSDDGTSEASGTESESTDDGPAIICDPGETQCADADTLETCSPTGLEWEPSPCGTHEQCNPCFGGGMDTCYAACVGPCDLLVDTPSSEGCSFFATGMFQAGQTIEDPPDALVVGNPHPDLTATIELYFAPEGSNVEDLVEGPVELLPGESTVFQLPPELTEYSNLATSEYRSGAVHHIVSDLPVVAYLHSPFEATSSNGSSLLLPEHVMTGNYVVYGNPAFKVPSYFVVIALEDQTTVTWRPTIDTAGDELPLPFVEGGASGEQLLNRLDNMRINSSIKFDLPSCEHDLSGTVIEADKPIWVVSAVRGARVPFCDTDMVEGCPGIMIDPLCESGSDFLQEQNLPLEYWGMAYVGPHAPLRGTEDHYWRIYAGDDNVTVTVTPPQPGTPINLATRGDWQELIVPNGTNLEFTGDGPFMPVQYTAGHYVSANIGSPAMVQMVPTAQFLDNYVFVTGFNYDDDYVQVIREAGTADVLLDGAVVTGWASVGSFEVATVGIAEGAHAIEGEDYFGIIQYGYTDLPDPNFPLEDPSAGYGYPGGMKNEVIFIP